MENMSDDIKIGQEYNLDMDLRYYVQNAEAAMKGDIVRGLVELITNSDESYNRLLEGNINVGGLIQISIERKRKNKNSIVKVLDRAEGMTLNEMVIKLKSLGGKTSGFMDTRGQGRRGLMGRGGKDCAIFGSLKYRSIKDGKYSEITISKRGIFRPDCEKPATVIERINLGIEKGNGTLVTLEVEPRFKMPSHDLLIKNLPKYYSLRDIASRGDRDLVLIDSSSSNKKENRLSYDEPKGEVVFDEKISIANYPEAQAHLIIKKSSNRIEPIVSPYWEGGIIVKSNYAIHGITPISSSISNNPYFEFYFGRIVCPYIDDLMHEYEEAEEEEIDHTQENPVSIIDPLRWEGLVKNHPFTKALYDEVSKHINILLKKDEGTANQKAIEIENKRTKDRFKKLASEASKFIKDHIEDIDSTDDETYLTAAEIPSGGIKIIPEGLKMLVNEERKIYIYTRASSENNEKQVFISTDSEDIKLSAGVVGLTDRGDGVFTAPVAVIGIKEVSAKIKLSWGSIDKYLPVSVVVNRGECKDIKVFQFEKENYAFQEGKEKNIRILAQWPEFIHGRVKVRIFLEESGHCELLTEGIILDYNRKSKEVFGRVLATGVARLRGLKAGGPVVLSTILQGREVSTKIRVIPKKEFGKNFEVKIVDEDIGDQRAVLVENVVKINGRHKNIKRYLGPPPIFSGQDSIHFRLLMAELIADTVARRVLELNAQRNVSEYKDMDVTSFYRKHRELMNAFLEKAHQIQIPENEIKVGY